MKSIAHKEYETFAMSQYDRYEEVSYVSKNKRYDLAGTM